MKFYNEYLSEIDLYLEAYIDNQFIELKNYKILYFILGRAKLGAFPVNLVFRMILHWKSDEKLNFKKISIKTAM